MDQREETTREARSDITLSFLDVVKEYNALLVEAGCTNESLLRAIHLLRSELSKYSSILSFCDARKVAKKHKVNVRTLREFKRKINADNFAISSQGSSETKEQE